MTPWQEKRALKIAKESALRAGKLLLKKLHSKREIQFKGNANNLVTDMDKASEALIVKTIRHHFPDHQIIAEEASALVPPAPSQAGIYRWHIDPLDGTVNYTHGFPVFSVSIGLEVDGEVRLGVVYNPNLGELFYAVRGGGAYKNGKSIHVSRTARLERGLLATGFPYDDRGRGVNLRYFNAILPRAQAIRRAGSAAIDLCYTAVGIFDGFWEIKLASWDIAAGYLIVQEAGGKATNLKGEKVDLYRGDLVASNGKIHSDILKLIRKAKGIG